jgi:hypothetical protein
MLFNEDPGLLGAVTFSSTALLLLVPFSALPHCCSHDSSTSFISVRGNGSPRASLSEWSYVCMNISSFVVETGGTFSRFGLVRGVVVVVGLCLSRVILGGDAEMFGIRKEHEDERGGDCVWTEEWSCSAVVMVI